MSISKILSKKGQVSMEMSILIFAAITVSTIASYYYITQYLNSNPNAPREAANKTINTLQNTTMEYANSMPTP
ncbi:class III signal peptide-containing protein [Methanothermococcus sp. SCGC AD-155-C09]|nr:class III signal peptide-containing protein [Methanothermococcus sp. SCGC AD-155-C09]